MKPPCLFSKLATIVCLAAVALGMVTEGDFGGNATPAELRWWALAGFIFFAVASALGALIEKMARKVGRNLQRVVNRSPMPEADSTNHQWRFFGLVGLVAIGLGFGMLVSAIWRDSILAWHGLAFLGAGAGLLVGRRLGLRILNS